MSFDDPSNLLFSLQKDHLLFKVLSSYPLPDLKIRTRFAEFKVDFQILAKLSEVFLMKLFSLGVISFSHLTISGIFLYFCNNLRFDLFKNLFWNFALKKKLLQEKEIKYKVLFLRFHFIGFYVSLLVFFKECRTQSSLKNANNRLFHVLSYVVSTSSFAWHTCLGDPIVHNSLEFFDLN